MNNKTKKAIIPQFGTLSRRVDDQIESLKKEIAKGKQSSVEAAPTFKQTDHSHTIVIQLPPDLFEQINELDQQTVNDYVVEQLREWVKHNSPTR